MRGMDTVASSSTYKKPVDTGKTHPAGLGECFQNISIEHQLRYGFDPLTLQILRSVARISSPNEE